MATGLLPHAAVAPPTYVCALPVANLPVKSSGSLGSGARVRTAAARAGEGGGAAFEGEAPGLGGDGSVGFGGSTGGGGSLGTSMSITSIG
jgi:hypothetical protein